MIKIEVEMSAVPFSRPRFGKHKKVFNSPRYSAFKTELGYKARTAMADKKILTGEVKMLITFCKNKKVTSRNFGDVDNLMKSVLDALNGICYLDDSQVIDLRGLKLFADKPKIIIQLEER